MNKNLKRALNTTAAVSMSLAMVLGAVSPVSAAFADREVTNMVSAENYIAELKDALAAAGFELSTLQADDQVKFAGVDAEKVFEFDGDHTWTLANELETELAKVLNMTSRTSEEFEIAQYLLEMPKALTAMTYGTNGSDGLQQKATALISAADGKLDVSQYDEAVELMEEMLKVEKYEGNLAEDKATDYTEAKDNLQDLIDDFASENFTSELDKYVTALEEEFEKFTKNEDTTALTAKSIKAEIEAIKKGSKGGGLTAANFRAFGEDSSVEAILEQFEELIEGAEAAEVALDKKNEATVAYTKDKAYFLNSDTKTTLQNAINDKNFENVLSNIDADDFAVLKAYKEDVLDVVYQLDAKQYGKNYVDKSEKTLYISKTAVDKLLDGFAASDATLTEIADKETGDRYYDLLEQRIEAVAADVEAVTEGLKGVTINNLTAKNVEKVKAAEEAIMRLAGDAAFGDDIFGESASYTKNMTADQKKEVRAVYRDVKALVDAMYDKGLVSPTIGWVSTPQGWEYYDANGKRVMEGWAAGNGYWSFMKNGYSVSNEWCAAKDGWYYMGADGKMVTGKVVIDGVEQDFGTDGIWVR